MLKLVGYSLSKTGAIFNRISKFFYYLGNKTYSPVKSLSEQNKLKWYSINGDKTLRVNYPLNLDSIVFDVGGYEGDWAAEIAARYKCSIYVFEPVKKFFSGIQDRFKSNFQVKVFQFGIGAKDENLEIAVMDESSSVFRNKSQRHQDITKQKIMLKSINTFVVENNISHIDLIKINIEGGEYDLLESMISSGLIKNILNVQVQFHDFVQNAGERMNKIKNKLRETHTLTYEYIYVWENWKRKT